MAPLNGNEGAERVVNAKVPTAEKNGQNLIFSIPKSNLAGATSLTTGFSGIQAATELANTTAALAASATLQKVPPFRNPNHQRQDQTISSLQYELAAMQATQDLAYVHASQ